MPTTITPQENKRGLNQSEALFYIYRNLRTGGFSVQRRGIVVDHLRSDECVLLYNVKSHIRQAGRKRAQREKQRNVHAFLCCKQYAILPILPTSEELNNQESFHAVSYAPFDDRAWHYKNTGKAFQDARYCILAKERAFAISETTASLIILHDAYKEFNQRRSPYAATNQTNSCV